MAGAYLAEAFARVTAQADSAQFKAAEDKAAKGLYDPNVTVQLGSDRAKEQAAELSTQLHTLFDDVKANVNLETTAAQLGFAKLSASADRLQGKLDNENITLAGADKAQLQLLALTVQADKLKASFGEADTEGLGAGLDSTGADAAQLGAKLGSLSDLAMPALIGAITALSPIILTLGFGLGGLGLAAYDLKGKLLDTDKPLASLKTEFGDFAHSLQGTVFADFNAGLNIAAGLLHDVEPIARATGSALVTMLNTVGAQFRSGEWQAFFKQMAQQAGPDLGLLTAAFTGLLAVLPPLLTDLQPVGTSMLSVVADTLKLISAVEKIQTEYGKLTASNSSAGLSFSGVAKAAQEAFDQFVPGAKYAEELAGWLGKLSGAATPAATHVAALAGSTQSLLHPLGTVTSGLGVYRDKTISATSAAQAEKIATDQLNTSLTRLAGGLLTSQQDQVTWKQAQQAATTAIKAASGSLDSNRSSSLAARAAIIQSTSAALAFAQQEDKQKGDVADASAIIRAQITYLQEHAGKSKVAAQEIDALRTALGKLPKNTQANVSVHGSGSGEITFSQQVLGQNAKGYLEFHAKGGRVGGHGHGDTVPAMLTPGEAVVPKHLVPAFAPLMKAHKIPGFAAGGIVGDATALSTGIGYTAHREVTAGTAAARAFGAAIFDEMRSALAAAAKSAAGGGYAGPGGGAPAANAALARKLAPYWSSGAEWAAWNNVAMAESGWNQFADNAASGAYGIPQALPFTKMPRAAWPASAGGSSNPTAQITWMISYIKGNYGDPINAWAHEQADHWYGKGGMVRSFDKGGLLPPGLSMAWNGTGRAERVSPAAATAPGDGALLGELRAQTSLLREQTALAGQAPARTAKSIVRRTHPPLGGGWSRIGRPTA